MIFDLDHSLKKDLVRVKIIKIRLLILIFDLDHFTSDLAHLCSGDQNGRLWLGSWKRAPLPLSSTEREKWGWVVHNEEN